MPQSEMLSFALGQSRKLVWLELLGLYKCIYYRIITIAKNWIAEKKKTKFCNLFFNFRRNFLCKELSHKTSKIFLTTQNLFALAWPRKLGKNSVGLIEITQIILYNCCRIITKGKNYIAKTNKICIFFSFLDNIKWPFQIFPSQFI